MLSLLSNADVAELADALDLGSSAERREGSSPFIRILNQKYTLLKLIGASCSSRVFLCK